MHPQVDEVIYSKRRTVSLEITPHAKLVVRMPKRADKGVVFNFIEAKSAWIQKKKEEMLKRLEELSSVEAITFTEEDKEGAADLIKERLDIFSCKMGVEYDSFRMSNSRTRWGVCYRRADIRINWRLIKAPAEILDYVVVHELAHIKEKNHSTRFWALVAQIFPDHKLRRKQLREFGKRSQLQYN